MPRQKLTFENALVCALFARRCHRGLVALNLYRRNKTYTRMQQKHAFSDAGERTRTRRKVFLHIVFAQLLFNNISQLKAGNKSPSAASSLESCPMIKWFVCALVVLTISSSLRARCCLSCTTRSRHHQSISRNKETIRHARGLKFNPASTCSEEIEDFSNS
jgi:hypothetical protein